MVMEWILALVAAGFTLVILEMFLPGIIIGVSGVICLITAVVLAFVHHGFSAGLWVATGVLAGGVLLTVLWMRNFTRLPFVKNIVLQDEISGTSVSAESGGQSLVGLEGEALTQLHPSGTVTIAGKRYDVVAESELIEQGSSIRVVQVEGSRIVVRTSEKGKNI